MSVEDQLEPLYDSGGHPTAATLAGLDLDGFDAVTTRRIRSHVTSCARCQEVLAGLHRSSSALAETPYPQMPDAVFTRIQETIRSEQALRAQSAPPAQPPSAPVVDLATERARRRRRTQWMSVAAAGIAVIAAAGITIGVTAGDDNGGSGKYAGGPPSSVVPSDQLPSDGQGSGNPAPAAAYTRQNLSASVPDIVHHAGLNVPGLPVSTQGAMKNPAKRAACVAALGDKRKLVAVQQADFEGQPSFVFVFAKGGQSTPNVYVVGPACGNGTADQRYVTHGGY
ncbi:MAG TPA: hypothetical protein VHC49_03600 [Mycobacteriales bacterium]|nr:hypothetical protein [Mycobacteriales bacterium]